MNIAIIATILALLPGENAAPGAYGQVSAIEATTQAASATVGVSAVSTARTWTNALETVVTQHRRYDFAVTNWDGNASIATNTLDSFSYSDWLLGGVTNMIVGSVVPSNILVTNVVETGGKLLAAEYVVTNSLGSVSVSNHHGTATPENAHFFGGEIIVTGASDGDSVKLILK